MYIVHLVMLKRNLGGYVVLGMWQGWGRLEGNIKMDLREVGC
jgi:hypothetical protein